MAHLYSKNLRLPFQEVVVRVQQNLLDQGFNEMQVLDISGDFDKNLSIRFRNYVIVTTCHTLLSYKAISLDPHIGAVLPCTIMIQEHENGMVEVCAVNPLERLDHNMCTSSLETVALEVSNHLRTAIDALRVKSEKFSFTYN